MTNEYNFKVGDKVRIKDSPLVNPDYVGRICEIASVTAGAYITFNDCDSKWHPCVLELVEPYDRRTAFLTRLQSLLREFDAEICCRGEDFQLYVDLNTGNKIERIEFPPSNDRYDTDTGWYLDITADHIMGFDKE